MPFKRDPPRVLEQGAQKHPPGGDVSLPTKSLQKLVCLERGCLKPNSVTLGRGCLEQNRDPFFCFLSGQVSKQPPSRGTQSLAPHPSNHVYVMKTDCLGPPVGLQIEVSPLPHRRRSPKIAEEGVVKRRGMPQTIGRGYLKRPGSNKPSKKPRKGIVQRGVAHLSKGLYKEACKDQNLRIGVD